MDQQLQTVKMDIAEWELVESSTSIDEFIPDRLREMVVHLHDEMHLTHGSLYINLWLDTEPDDLIKMWCRGLRGLTPKEIRRGMEMQRDLEYPPALSKFKTLCRPAIDPEIAFYEALEQGTARECGKPNHWSHPAVFWAWRQLGPKQFREQSYSMLKNRWARILADQFKLGTWELIPEMVLSVGVDMKSTQICARGKAEIEKSLAEVMKTPKSNIDHLHWARDAVERVARGDRTVPLYTLKLAQSALGLN